VFLGGSVKPIIL